MYKNKSIVGLVAILLSVIAFCIIPSYYPLAPYMASIVVLMAIFWVFEIVPIAVTSLFPIILFPLFGIMDSKSTALFFGKEIIFLFFFCLLLAQGIQNANLHQRIALKIVNRIGSKPSKLILGFMLATAGLSMWISNTASVMVMLPIGLSILKKIEQETNSSTTISNFSVALMLGIAYSADIGGMATLIGTPPNMVFLELYHETFPNLPKISFLNWMGIGLPVSIIFLLLGWMLMTKVIFKMPKNDFFKDNKIVPNLLSDLGKMKRDEILSGSIFLTAVILWVTGSDITISESFSIRGWRNLFGLEMVSDASIAIATSLFLFIIPSQNRPNEKLLTWHKAKELPWGILFLFGGGFAIAGGFNSSGLSQVIGNLFLDLNFNSPIIIVVVICFVLTFLTEITSNTATTNLILPILAQASILLELDPRILMIPATLSASCAFMMPIASPTQAIVFGSGYLKIKQMVRAGFLFNLLGIIIVSSIFYILIPFLFSSPN